MKLTALTFTLSIALLGPIGAGAETISDVLSKTAAKVRELEASTSNTPSKVNAAVASLQQKFKDKCQSEENCFVEECDVAPDSCRPDRILLFRGEAKIFPLPVSSGLSRALAESALSQDLSKLDEFLKQLLKPILPISVSALFEGHSPAKMDATLSLSNGKTTWTRNDDRNWKSTQIHDGQELQRPFEFFYVTHVSGGYPSLRIGTSEAKSADPLISFSADPEVALRFSRLENAERSRLIIISVPKSDLLPQNSKRVAPGAIVDPSELSMYNEYSDESEYDAFMFVPHELVYRSFIVTAGTKTLN